MRFIYMLLPFIVDGFFFSNSFLPYRISRHKANMEEVLDLYNDADECDLTNISSCEVVGGYCESGDVICPYCRGTGFFMIQGELLEANTTGALKNGKAYIKCNNCDGAGYIANWHKKSK